MIEYRVQKWILHQKYWIEASVRPGVKHPGVEKKTSKSPVIQLNMRGRKTACVH